MYILLDFSTLKNDVYLNMILLRQLIKGFHLHWPSLIDVMKLFTAKVPAYILLLTILFAGSLLYYRELHPVKVIEKIESENNNDIHVIRSTKYKYIRPVILADHLNEDNGFDNIRSELNNYINSEKNIGTLKSASVYVREFEKGKWFSINPTEQFSPGSMMKIATLLTYLKDSEHNPELLSKRIQFKAQFSEMPVQKILSGHLTTSKYYTVKELLEAMIIDSDNDATALLSQSMNANIYFDLLKSLDLSIPNKEQTDYPLTTIECSRLIRVIFNSSFLETKNSEYAMSLLTKSKFKDGLAKVLPDGVMIAHKFGEKSFPSEQQLHETAIIYSNNKPYLLTVMTKGEDQEKLKIVLNSISQKVYSYMATR